MWYVPVRLLRRMFDTHFHPWARRRTYKALSKRRNIVLRCGMFFCLLTYLPQSRRSMQLTQNTNPDTIQKCNPMDKFHRLNIVKRNCWMVSRWYRLFRRYKQFTLQYLSSTRYLKTQLLNGISAIPPLYKIQNSSHFSTSSRWYILPPVYPRWHVCTGSCRLINLWVMSVEAHAEYCRTAHVCIWYGPFSAEEAPTRPIWFDHNVLLLYSSHASIHTSDNQVQLF